MNLIEERLVIAMYDCVEFMKKIFDWGVTRMIFQGKKHPIVILGQSIENLWKDTI